MSYAVGAAVAAVLAFIELNSRLRSRPTWRGGAWFWWILRLLLEGAIGALAAGAVQVATGGALGGLPDWLAAGVGGGLAGPGFVRMPIVTIGKGEDQRSIGPATLYEPIRSYIEDQLDDIGANEQQKWIHREVIPRLAKAGTTPDQVANRLKTYVRGLTRLKETDILAEIKYIEDVIADSKSGPAEKIEALLLRALKLRAYRTIEDLA